MVRVRAMSVEHVRTVIDELDRRIRNLANLRADLGSMIVAHRMESGGGMTDEERETEMFEDCDNRLEVHVTRESIEAAKRRALYVRDSESREVASGD